MTDEMMGDEPGGVRIIDAGAGKPGYEGPPQEEIERRAAEARGEGAPKSAPDDAEIWGDAETAEIAKQKGWKTPLDAARAYKGAERMMFEATQNAAEARAEAQAAQEFIQSNEYQQGFAQQQGITNEQSQAIGQLISQFADPATGEVDMVRLTDATLRLSGEIADARIAAALPQMVERYVQPIAERYESQETAEAHAEIAEAYGDSYEEVNDLASEIVDSDPEFWEGVADRMGMGQMVRMAHAQAAQQMTTQSRMSERAQADGFTIGAGGRNASGGRKTPQQIIAEQIMGGASSARPDEIFG